MAENKKKCCNINKAKITKWLTGPSFTIYFNYVLSAWGDWMWQFAVGLYLVHLADGSLRLTAIFGFTGGTLMLILGGIIGDWVDRNGRMKVVTVTLFIQNISVSLCAVSVCVTLVYQPVLFYWKLVSEAIIISLAILAYISSMSYKIAIEKDWIVVVASGNSSQLTNLNAVIRGIDLSCKILAPTVVGLIMAKSHVISAIFIAVWNVLSVFCEFALLRRVYNMVPQLASKAGQNQEQGKDKEYELKNMKKSEEEEMDPMTCSDEPDQNQNELLSNGRSHSPTSQSNGHSPTLQSDVTEPLKKSPSKTSVAEMNSSKKPRKTCLQLACEPFVVLVHGWRTYMGQVVVLAGLALSFLYMTVLGFDSVTIGYIYASGVEEYFVGISMGLAGVTGIMGAVLFSKLNKRIGLQRTGLVAFSCEILFLTLSVASVWAPGTLFDPTFSKPQPNCTLLTNVTMATPTTALNDTITVDDHYRVKRDSGSLLAFPGVNLEELGWFELMRHGLGDGWSGLSVTSSGAGHHLSKRDLVENGTSGSMLPGDDMPSTNICPERENMSVILFLLGIVLSRVGLWMADLVVTQLLQENVPEGERGVVGGVQNSLNRLMDMIKFLLVILWPQVETFGILILLSFLFICLAGGLFIVHVSRFQPTALRRNSKNKENADITMEIDVKNPIEV